MRAKLLLSAGLFLLVLRCQDDEGSGDASNNGGKAGTAGQGATGGGGGTSGTSGTGGDSNTAGESGETGKGGVAGTGATAGTAGTAGSGVAGDAGGDPGGMGGEGGGGDGSGTVTGRILGQTGGVLSGVVVTIGDDTVVSDANGVFTVPDVPATYDLIAIEETEHYVRVVRGLTTRAPIFWSLGRAAERTATVNGTITGGVAAPYPARVYTHVGYVGPNNARSPSAFAVASVGSYAVNPTWVGPNAVNGTLYALQGRDDAQAHPIAYEGFGSKAFTVSAGGAFGPSTETSIALRSVTSHTVTGAVTVPAGYDPVVWVNFGPFLVNLIDETAGGPYSFLLPSGIPELTTFVQLHAEREISTNVVEYSESHFLVTDSTSTLALTAPAAPQALLPIDGAVGVNLDTNFSWAQPPSSVATIAFMVGAWTFDLTTAGTTLRLPDLTSFGIALTPGAACQWGVGVVLNATTADAFSEHEADSIGYIAAHGHSGVAFSPLRDCTIAN